MGLHWIDNQGRIQRVNEYQPNIHIYICTDIDMFNSVLICTSNILLLLFFNAY